MPHCPTPRRGPLPAGRPATRRRRTREASLLRSGINGQGGPDDDSELWTIVTDLLRESPAPPALRRALWQVAATIPGVELVGGVTGSAGPPGIAVERDMTSFGWLAERYVLDPADGRLLEILDHDLAGNVGSRMTILEQGPPRLPPSQTRRSAGPARIPTCPAHGRCGRRRHIRHHEVDPGP